ncbi:SDR family NAD(P)-dependent oxidoreductase [Lapillicoccus jejuensis]|uniref:Short-subunit dehydrogenase n=1 Tax=Lapillicoccus jejuensis TaxID=402171 RepID=A0A542E396_9MICO|nr:SDR family NAD(P)-dependent oxidoreductase [Lapillicoccus jejuensis]TQJ09797.1 short-subunit dehydrogenase [Lapillicoccus jejuensis]
MSRAPSVVVVTGASSGIGLETVALLRARGDHVVLASRSPEALRAAVAGTTPTGPTPDGTVPGRVLVVPTDVGDRDAVEALFAAARAELGRVDAVVHAAAVLAYGRFDDVPADVYDRALQTTLIGTANVARCALAEFGPRERGSLVVVGSLLGKIATPLMSSYVTAKWGVHGLVRCLQLEARSTPGIEVSLVSPGGVDTPIYHLAGTYVGRHGKPPPPVVPAAKVARAVVRCLDHPRRDVNADLGPANAVTVLGFRAMPAVFDLLVGPLLRWTGFGAAAPEPTPGNVTGPRPLLEASSGGFGSVPLDLPEPVRRAVPAGLPRAATAVVLGAGVTSAAVRWATRRVSAGR